jgi:hypothetical protein
MAIATRPKRTTGHKKRAGKHHRHNKPYLKAYWPYIPMLLIVGAGIMINSIWSAGSVLGDSSNLNSSYLLSETNQNRSAQQETALSISPQLSAAAQAKADDMVKHDYWSHNSPDGKTPWSFITTSGYQYQAAGENLAYGFSDASGVVAGWMNSPEHRDNILNAAYADVGFGVAEAPNYQGKGPQTIIVAEYAQPAAAVANFSFSVPKTDKNAPASVKGDDTQLTAQPVSRIAVLTGGNAAWSGLLVSALAGAAFMLFLVRHGRRLHKLLVRGEVFVAHHPWLDITVVFVFTAGFVLTRTTGITG